MLFESVQSARLAFRLPLVNFASATLELKRPWRIEVTVMASKKSVLSLILTTAIVLSLESNQSFAARILPTPSPLTGALDPANRMNVQLHWGDVSGETGYLVERKSSTGSSFAEVAKLGPDVESYRDITTVSQSYEYRIRAYKVRGGKLTYSDYTNSVAVATSPNAVTTDTSTGTPSAGTTDTSTGTTTDPNAPPTVPCL